MSRGRFAVLAVLAVVLGTLSCAPPEPPPLEVLVYGREDGRELEALEAALAEFHGKVGDRPIRLKVTGDERFEDTIDGRDDVDIAIYPQPGKLRERVDRERSPVSGRRVHDLPPAIAQRVKDDFLDSWVRLVTFGDVVRAVPVKAELKSLVWYNPQRFHLRGYVVPTTLAGFEGLVDEMRAKGDRPLCLGLSGGGALGPENAWPFTDWVEDYVLRLHGPDVYDHWVQEMDFSDDRIEGAARRVVDLWERPDAVFAGLRRAGGREGAIDRHYRDAGRSLLSGECQLYRLSNFYAATFAPTDFSNRLVDAFVLPGAEGGDPPLLTAGSFAVMLRAGDEVAAVMEYLASVEFAEARSRRGGYLSPNRKALATAQPTRLEQRFARSLSTSGRVHFDASDAMPAAVGSDRFWKAAGRIIEDREPLDQVFAGIGG